MSIACFAKPLRDDRAGGELGGSCNRAVEQRFGLDHLVDESDAQRFVGVDLTSAEDDVLRSRHADESRQPLRASTARDDAEEDLGLAEPRPGRGDAEVTGERELAAAAQRVTAHRGDRGAGDVGDCGQRSQEQSADLLGLRRTTELADVRACGEHSVAAGHDNGAGWIVDQRLGRGFELRQHLRSTVR